MDDEELTWGNSLSMWSGNTTNPKESDTIAIVPKDIEKYTDYDRSYTSAIKTDGIIIANKIDDTIQTVGTELKKAYGFTKIAPILIVSVIIWKILK